MTRIAASLLLLLGFLLGGCDTLPLAGPHETIKRNVVYTRRGAKDLHLDLYVPKTNRPAPVVVWIHGGAWKYGDKSYLIRVRKLTGSGFAVVAVQYRRSWESLWPAQRDDCADALRWVRQHGGAYGIDGQRLGVCGDSSGGHVAALLGLLEGRRHIKAVCALYPPTDLISLGKHYAKSERTNLITQLFGGPVTERSALAFQASPVNHVTPSAPPFLLLHGGRDRIVPLEQSEDLHRRLQEAGLESTLHVFPNLPHGFGLDAAREAEVVAFFRKHL